MTRCCVIAAALLLYHQATLNGSAAQPPASIQLYLVGDSTVATGSDEQPVRGWGQFLQPYFNDNVRVVNRAIGGRSSLSFQREGLWRDVLREKPNFVLIQFGHNDATPPPNQKGTLPDGEYRECLERYVETTRKLGATPILVTPMRMRMFDHGQLSDPLGPYANAVRSVAAKKKVLLVDLHALTTQLFQRLGEERSEQLASSPGDRLHFNEMGAKAMAELVVRELRRLEPRLAAALRDSKP